MRRSSFVEFIIRAAADVYSKPIDKGDFDLAASCRRLLSTALRNTEGEIELWQTFREMYIWTLPINDFITKNYDNFYMIF